MDDLVAQSFAHMQIILDEESCRRRQLDKSLPKPVHIVEGEKSFWHYCGPRCEHLKLDDYGSYVCSLTGVVFGQQITNGSYNEQNFKDDVLPVHIPSKRKSRHNSIFSYDEVFSATNSCIGLFTGGTARAQIEHDKLQRSMKSGLRLASLETDKSAVERYYIVLQEIERNGAILAPIKVSEIRLTALANIIAIFICSAITPYQQIHVGSKPNLRYLVIGTLYLFSSTSLGKMHIPILQNYLPEEKALKYFGLVVSRVTMAKRYAQEALEHYVSAKK